MGDQKQLWINRSAAKAFEVEYKPPPPSSNPRVRGLALYYGAQMYVRDGFYTLCKSDNRCSISSSSLIQSYLWSNAGFNKLRNRPELDGVDPRYEPTVIRASKDSRPDGRTHLKALLDEDLGFDRPSTGVYPSILDYHEAYRSGKLTPTAVAEALLPLIRRDVKSPTKHSTSFLETRDDIVLKAAEESTQRYKNGSFLSPLDGVPVAVKDEEDLAGYEKCLGTKLDFRRKDNATSYCVQQWLDAGAVLMGKTTMHELGLDTTNKYVYQRL